MGASGGYTGPLEKVGLCQWRIPKSYREDMRVDGLIFADDTLIEQIKKDQGPEQVANVATLPGIQKASLAMPDIHWGYGFCIGGVAATDPEEGGVISPGGVGYDINCGVRLLRTDLDWTDVKDRIKPLVDQLFRDIPTGVGQSGQYRLRQARAGQAAGRGVVVRRRTGLRARTATWTFTEAGGRLDGADPGRVSDRAIQPRVSTSAARSARATTSSKSRSSTASTTSDAAEVMGLREGQITVLIHSGSRGLGYQVCDDYLGVFKNAPKKYGFELPDWQLACAPVRSPEGQAYLGAMRAAANFAWCNRQLLTHQAREVFARIFGKPWEKLGMDLVYDVAHNIAKFEEHDVGGGEYKQVCVHRKGATRAFPPGHPEIPAGVPRDRPAGDHSRQHGDGELGAGRPAGQHGAVVRHDLPRRGADDEPDGGRQAGRRAGGSTRSWTRSASSPGPAATRGSPRSSRPRTRTSTMVVDVVDKAGISQEGRPAAAGRRDQRLSHRSGQLPAWRRSLCPYHAHEGIREPGGGLSG